ncbi:hypothetical protein DY218_17175 [Streptomyces triticagri]|uniref:Uncharacterized protein n=1 Tax=Streptomyces triticagri TaxID=2293568 RepID=A0A372M5D0_9ACTN|nr:DUF6480 family protein [Streptomyces triticagri]RFU85507.1 hypothetical protein DY218_17175 [Streptomyces triticagri]
MNTHEPHPDQARPRGAEPGGVPPQETPPGESSLSGAGPEETHNPTKGWAKAPLTLILLLAFCVAAFFLAYALIVV